METKKEASSKETIISYFMNYTLEHNEKPKSVYQLMNKNGKEESEFYSFFGTLEGLEKEIFVVFLENTLQLLEKNEDYGNYEMKNKMLSFYFTFFEMLAANRSYVLMCLKEHKNQLKNMNQLSLLRTHFKEYVASILTDEYRIKQEKLQNIQQKGIAESAWIQLLLTLKFWMEDTSANFEKTDIFIEKSVKAVFELMNISPIESLIDFGKFIFKEKMQTTK